MIRFWDEDYGRRGFTTKPQREDKKEKERSRNEWKNRSADFKFEWLPALAFWFLFSFLQPSLPFVSFVSLW
jgi:hypothetical protein